MPSTSAFSVKTAKRIALGSFFCALVLVVVVVCTIAASGIVFQVKDCVDACNTAGLACVDDLACTCSCNNADEKAVFAAPVPVEPCVALKSALVEEYKAHMWDEMCKSHAARDEDHGHRDHGHDHHHHRQRKDEDQRALWDTARALDNLDHDEDIEEDWEDWMKARYAHAHVQEALARAQGVCALALAGDDARVQCPAFADGTGATERFLGANASVPGFHECATRHSECMLNVKDCAPMGIVGGVAVLAALAAVCVAVACLSLIAACFSSRASLMAHMRAHVQAHKAAHDAMRGHTDTGIVVAKHMRIDERSGAYQRFDEDMIPAAKAVPVVDAP